MYYGCYDDSIVNLTIGLIEEFVEVVAPMSPEVMAPVISEAPVIPQQRSNGEEHKAPPNPPSGVESLEEDTCRKFKQQTCGCHMVPGKKHCNDLFPVEHYLKLRAQSSFLMRDELDLALMGSIMSSVVRDDYV